MLFIFFFFFTYVFFSGLLIFQRQTAKCSVENKVALHLISAVALTEAAVFCSGKKAKPRRKNKHRVFCCVHLDSCVSILFPLEAETYPQRISMPLARSRCLRPWPCVEGCRQHGTAKAHAVPGTYTPAHQETSRGLHTTLPPEASSKPSERSQLLASSKGDSEHLKHRFCAVS